MSDQAAMLAALMAYRADLEARLERESNAGDQPSAELTELLLKQCDFLIEKAWRPTSVDVAREVSEELC